MLAVWPPRSNRCPFTWRYPSTVPGGSIAARGSGFEAETDGSRVEASRCPNPAEGAGSASIPDSTRFVYPIRITAPSRRGVVAMIGDSLMEVPFRLPTAVIIRDDVSNRISAWCAEM